MLVRGALMPNRGALMLVRGALMQRQRASIHVQRALIGAKVSIFRGFYVTTGAAAALPWFLSLLGVAGSG
jgi:hypothetical protein